MTQKDEARNEWIDANAHEGCDDECLGVAFDDGWEAGRLLSWRESRDDFLTLRGVDLDDVCNSCTGMGRKLYGSTATWRGGVGGQRMTMDVCDKCWGSGSKSRPGVNLRRVKLDEQ